MNNIATVIVGVVVVTAAIVATVGFGRKNSETAFINAVNEGRFSELSKLAEKLSASTLKDMFVDVQQKILEDPSSERVFQVMKAVSFEMARRGM